MKILLKLLIVSLLLISIFHSESLCAQNIVPNGDLEDVNICTEYKAPCSPSAWFMVKKSVPRGYYHVYPDHAASGKQYFELNVVRRDSARQYWQTMLLCNLVAGEKYSVSVKIGAGETGPNLNDIGFYFTSGFIFSDNDTLLRPLSFLKFLDAKVSRLKNNWFLLKKEFVATDNAGFLIIGNFAAADNVTILKTETFIIMELR